MLVKNKYTGKSKEEALNNAKIELQETEDNLYVKELEVKSGLFSKKVEIEVIRKEDVVNYIKELVKDIITGMGLTCNLEVKKRENGLNITILSDNNSILIGKNGRTLDSITVIVKHAVFNEIGENFPVTIDVGEEFEYTGYTIMYHGEKLSDFSNIDEKFKISGKSFSDSKELVSYVNGLSDYSTIDNGDSRLEIFGITISR